MGRISATFNRRLRARRAKAAPAASSPAARGRAPAARGRLKLTIADGLDQRELPIFADLRDALVPRLTAVLEQLGHEVERLELPSDARPFPGAGFVCRAVTAAGDELAIHCELCPRRFNSGRVGSVRYVVGEGAAVAAARS